MLKNERGNGIGYFVTVIVAQIVLGILASMIVMWFSRQREFRADAGGAQLAGTATMIGALEALQACAYHYGAAGADGSLRHHGGRAARAEAAVHEPPAARRAHRRAEQRALTAKPRQSWRRPGVCNVPPAPHRSTHPVSRLTPYQPEKEFREHMNAADSNPANPLARLGARGAGLVRHGPRLELRRQAAHPGADRIDWVRTLPFILMHAACLFVFVVGREPGRR